jgi:hypothetical protein
MRTLPLVDSVADIMISVKAVGCSKYYKCTYSTLTARPESLSRFMLEAFTGITGGIILGSIIVTSI